MSERVKIEVYMNMSCTSEPKLRENIAKAFELEGVEAEVIYKRLSAEEAEKLGFKGSPTILINGEELQPLPMGNFT